MKWQGCCHSVQNTDSIGPVLKDGHNFYYNVVSQERWFLVTATDTWILHYVHVGPSAKNVHCVNTVFKNLHWLTFY